MSSNLEWAQSILGRDWEIFWDNSNGTDKAASSDRDDAILPVATAMDQLMPLTMNDQALANINVHLPPLVPGEYDTIVQSTTSGLLMDVISKNECVAFKGYKRFPDGSMGPAELKKCIRNVGDIFVAVDGISVVGKSFPDVIQTLRESAQKPYVVLRLKALSSYGNNNFDASAIAPQKSPTGVINLTAPLRVVSCEQAPTEEVVNNDNEVEDISDWYDGRILSFASCESGHIFDIQFVGEGKIYSMNLNRALVRPSARAWLMRTKALLSSNSAEHWEAALPADTATLEDRAHLQDLRQTCGKNEPAKSLSCATFDIDFDACFDQYSQVQRMQYYVRAQMYLRTKLSRIVYIGEQKDENEPTEAYVAFLVSCLEKVDEACKWYHKCWQLIQQVCTSSVPSTLIDTERVHKECIEAGYVVISNTLKMDTGPSGCKRLPTISPPGARRTKRRRIQRNLNTLPSGRIGNTSTDEDADFFDVGDHLLFSSTAVQRFTLNARREGRKWFEAYCLDILMRISRCILEPVEDWTRTADSILGERPNVDEDASSAETSVEDREDDDAKDDDEMEDHVDDDVYRYQDVKEVLDRVSPHPVLRKVDLSLWTLRLRTKLGAIEEFEREAWRLLSTVANEPSSSPESDFVLVGLEKLKSEVNAPASLLHNVVPLGKSPDSKLTKQVIDDAYAWRQWVVDLTQAERHRERVAFIQDVVARAPNLPHLPAVPSESADVETLSSKLGRVVARVQHISAKLYCNVHTITQYEHDLARSSDHSTDSTGLRTLQGIGKALDTLALLPVLSLVEEKLAVRKDFLLWVEDVNSCLRCSTRSQSFGEFQLLYKRLTNILGGSSTGRERLILNLSRNDSVEKEIRLFSNTDASDLSGKLGATFQALYLEAAAWKERAEAIIMALRVHGNKVAGDPMPSHKTSAMVDYKRMADLLQEYGRFDVSLPDLYFLLQTVYLEATKWSERVNAVVEQEEDILGCLLTCRDERPRGVMIDPARHTLDAVIELLDWHKKVKQATNTSDSAVSSCGSRRLSSIFSLIFEGLDVVERYASSRKSTDQFAFDGGKFLAFLSRTSESVKPSKIIALSKLESAPLGRQVITRLFSDTIDAAHGYPLFSILHLVWAARVSDFVYSASDEAHRKRPTLQEALALGRSEPKAPGTPSNILIGSFLENEMVQFLSLIEEANAIETQAKQLIAPEKYTFRGSINLTGEVRNYLASLKNLQSRYKAPKHGVKGLILDIEYERCLDRITKDLSWLVRTLGFSVLHSDDLDVDETSRLPLSELVWLYDRIPPEGDEIVGDIPRIAVRVKELYDAAEMWQERVQSLLSLSIRGAKRRHVTSQEGELDGHDGQAKVSNLQLAELVKDPILKSVLIPSENAVRDVLRKVEEFEKLMHDLLGKDFDGTAADRAPYPEGSSFVGVGDEFHLYRLTGSTMFASLKSSISEISLISADIAADTPGKEVFEWISQCVCWINALNDVVTEVSPFGGRDRLVIPVGEGARLLDHGRTLFLDISEDIKKSLSAQRIGVSTNKQHEKLTVTIAKGGALHSMGGTAIKWCPLIFDWLKQDLDSHHFWVERAHAIIDEANRSKESLMKAKDISQGSLNNAYFLAENLRVHLDDGRDSLVVVPAKPLIDQIASLHMFFSEWINANAQSTTEAGSGLSLKIAKSDRYYNANVLVQERNTLLDSLLIRRRIKPLSSSEDVPLLSGDSDVREKARSKLENKVMKKGVRMMNLGVEGRGDVALHCTLKAWEIEGAAFSEYGDEITVTSQYTSKLATIIKNLDPVKPRALCSSAGKSSLRLGTVGNVGWKNTLPRCARQQHQGAS
ncbi:Transcription factor S-II (TFIIS) [Fragilaria crotonensis]|nr:Transcription factor S-II (TFIIS) [Fragilaria crotonensis]